MSKIPRSEDLLRKRKIKEIMKKASVSRCVAHSLGGCSKGVIRAHSIQNNKILNNISENGMVIALGKEGNFEEVGRNVATTFSGFCLNHDTKLFSDIENRNYNISDKKQQFLFAYRALAKEIIAKERQKNIFELNVKIATLPKDIFYWSKLLEGINLSLSDLSSINNVLDSAIKTDDFDSVETKHIVFDKDAKFAVSSVFHVEQDFEGNQVNNLLDINQRAKPLFLTIFPQEHKTYVLLSCLREDSLSYNFLKEQLVDLPKEHQSKKISLLISMYCENIAYSPKKWGNLSEEVRKDFVNLFEESIFGEKSDYSKNTPPINFFE